MKIKTCKVANYIDVEELQHHPSNEELRHISESRMAELKQSLIKKGLYEPLLVWSQDNIVLAGNQRLKAIKELIAEGYTFLTPTGKKNQIPVVIEDVTEAKAIEILHQANNHQGNWVEEKLAQAIKEAQELGLSAIDLGYTESYAKKILADADAYAAELSKGTEYGDKNKEINTKDYEPDFAHTCPSCKFQFDD